jgi:hypothetical protein
MKIMAGSLGRNFTLALVSFLLFPLVYSIHFVNISIAQEKILENGWTKGKYQFERNPDHGFGHVPYPTGIH